MKNRLTFPILALTIFLFGLLSMSINAQTNDVKADFKEAIDLSSDEQMSPVQANDQGVAIDGYDPVAYFDQGKAVRGQQPYNCEYLGRQWYFSSAENRDRFLADPEKFAPAYGGYCAHSLGDNKLIRSNPESFAIKDSKLHLYANERLAKKDREKDTIKFKFDKKERDNNWLTFQSDF